MRRLTLIVVLIAFTFSCGGQWPLLQGVAWVNMICEYSQLVPLPEAAQMTFSGQYPCELCKIIAEKRQSENTKYATSFKYEKKAVSPSLLVEDQIVSAAPQFFLVSEPFFLSRSEAPPTPPPRFA